MKYDVSVRFAKKYNTSPDTFWKIVELRKKKVRVIDIKAIIDNRVSISYGNLYYWCGLADKKVKRLKSLFRK